jgi:hypothetical protein
MQMKLFVFIRPKANSAVATVAGIFATTIFANVNEPLEQVNMQRLSFSFTL